MKKVKYLVMIFLMTTFIMIIPSLVNAAETFTTSDGIVATKSVESNDGTIDFKLTNIALSSEGQYNWSLATTPTAGEVTDWYTLGDFSEKNKTTTIQLTPSNGNIKKILRVTNTAYLYIKDVKNEKIIVNALKVDLTLPPMKAIDVQPRNDSNKVEITPPYGIDNGYYQFEKITDSKIIEAYQEAIANNSSLDTIPGLKTIDDVPEENWKAQNWDNWQWNSDINSEDWPKEDGLYYLWMKVKDTDSKTVIGYTLWYGDIQGPTVKSIYVSSPSSGTYKTGQTVKINVNFSEKITGTTVPTLKIRFGESAERSVTNGTIKSDYIEYSYNIQDSDIGQIATVDLSGGAITDAEGNAAKLSCPLITGSTIKANVDGTTTNQTDNQDTYNNNQTEKPSTNNSTTNTDKDKTETPSTNNSTTNTDKDKTETPSTNKNNTTSTSSTNKNNTTSTPSTNKTTTTTTTNSAKTSNKNDITTSNIKLPNTGVGTGIIIIIALGLIIAGFSYFKFKRLKNIK